jgi:hypothetical protein
MPALYTPGSFSKDFAWSESYKRLYEAIRNGFSKRPEPVSRENWRRLSDIDNKDLELIPLNFFLYTKNCIDDDFVLIDRLVELAIKQPYDRHFAQLSLFALHLANSGTWRRSQWSDGRVAAWANEFIRDRVWRSGSWSETALERSSILSFIEEKIEGQSRTLTKVFTNYHHMLRNAGVIVDGQLQNPNLRDTWYVDAVQLFWDRAMFDGKLNSSSDQAAFERAFLEAEIYKLLACDEEQGIVFARAAFREYSRSRRADRTTQLRNLRIRLAA